MATETIGGRERDLKTMDIATNVESDTIWLQLQNYRVVLLNPHLDGRAELERAINRGVPAHPDLHRPDFYDVELDHRWAYVHVRDHVRTVYLVAYFGSGREPDGKNATKFGLGATLTHKNTGERLPGRSRSDQLANDMRADDGRHARSVTCS